MTAPTGRRVLDPTWRPPAARRRTPPDPAGEVLYGDGGGEMPEAPVYGYQPYRAWGKLPREVGWRARLADWLFGPRHNLLYLGITSRAGIARWIEHFRDKSWRRDVRVFELDDSVWWPTRYDYVEGDDGEPVMLVDPASGRTRPARPGEVDGPAGEGAETGELRMIRGEAPVHNEVGNDAALNGRAVNRTKRILPRHVALWRRQAAVLALTWFGLSAACTWLLYGGGGPAAAARAVAAGVGLAAALMHLWRILRLASRGTPRPRRRRRRRP